MFVLVMARSISLSISLSTLALLLFLSPNVSSWLSLDRAAVESGQLWRLLTGHWVHWSAEHLGWSLLVFFAVGAFWEKTGWEKTGRRYGLLICTVGSALLISLAVWFLQPELESYRGLSGIDCALVTGAACDALGRAWRQGQRALTGALLLTLMGYTLKVGYEMATGGTVFVGNTVFVDTESASFAAVPLAHLVGGGFGCLVGGWLAVVDQVRKLPLAEQMRRIYLRNLEPSFHQPQQPGRRGRH